jgi:class 3 adenylate cyclase/DNA-binding beta-propeller fold protein YncE
MPGGDRSADRAVATVFFTDMVGSTELAARLGDQRWRELLGTYHRVVGRAVRQDGGRGVDSAGDGLFAVFDSPRAAIRCAGRLTDELHRLGIEVRTGLHTGEVEHMRGKVGGIAVHLGARVSAAAVPGEILVTSTVRDLVAGSEVRCLDRGTHALKGIPGEWHLYGVDRPEAVPLADDATLGERWRPTLTGARRGRRIRLGVLAALLAGAAITVALLITHRGSSAPQAVVPEANTVARVDAAAGAFVAAVRTGNQPSDLAVGGGSVWVGNYLDGTVARVDAATGAVTGTFAPGGKPTGLAYGHDAVWVTTQFGQTSGAVGSVIRFNPVTNGIDRVIPVGNGVHSIAYGQSPEGIWVTNEVDDTIVLIDPVTNGVDPKPIAIGRKPEAIAVGGGFVWVGGADRTLLRIDPVSRRIVTIQLRSTPTAIAFGAGGVWVASNDGNSVIRVDPGNDSVVKTILVDAGPSGIAAADGAVWVAASTAGLVDRIDPLTNEVVARLAVHGKPLSVAPLAGDAWITVSGQ